MKTLQRISFFLVAVTICTACTSNREVAERVETAETSQLKHIAGHLSVIDQGEMAALDFCGHVVPLQQEGVRKKLDRELKRHQAYPKGAKLILKRAARYQEDFTRILRANDIPEDFFYMAVAESNLANASSPVGAQGFWQFMKPTARHYGLEISETVDERFHPTKATYAAVRYLKDLYREFGDWTLVAAAYNMGSPRLHRAIKQQGSSDYFSLRLNRETSRYIYRILSFKSLLEEPWRYGIAVDQQELYNPIPFRTVKLEESTPNLATFAQEHGVSYRKLRTLNPWLVTHRLDVPDGQSYEIRLPIQENLQAHELFVDHAPGPVPTVTPKPELEELPAVDPNTSTSDA